MCIAEGELKSLLSLEENVVDDKSISRRAGEWGKTFDMPTQRYASRVDRSGICCQMEIRTVKRTS
jgi:hypothetical protein